MGLFNWQDRQQAHWKTIMEGHLQSWQDAIQIEQDLVCRNCYQRGPWTFGCFPMLVTTQHTTNPMVALCPCGACLTIEEGIAMHQLNKELATCFHTEGA
jgi:hypothetical protein